MNNVNKTLLTRIVATRLTMKCCENLEDIAKQQNMTRAALIRQILMEWVDEKIRNASN